MENNRLDLKRECSYIIIRKKNLAKEIIVFNEKKILRSYFYNVSYCIRVKRVGINKTSVRYSYENTII